MNEYLAGTFYTDARAAFAHRRHSSSHAASAQQNAANSPCISLGVSHGQGSEVSP